MPQKFTFLNIREFKLTISSDAETECNTGSQKFQQLKNILSEARDSKFRLLLPEKFWRYMDEEIVNSDRRPVRFISSRVCRINIMFEVGAWKMFCVKFSFKEIRSERVRQWLREFADYLSRVENRSLERERFLFLFRCENIFAADAPASRNTVLKSLMEYGLSDLKFALLTAAEIDEIDSTNPKEELGNERLKAAREIVSIHCQRYAEQIMLKKMHDMLREILTQEGFHMNGHGNFRRVEKILKDASDGQTTYDEIFAANEWLTTLFNNLRHFLDIGTHLPV